MGIFNDEKKHTKAAYGIALAVLTFLSILGTVVFFRVFRNNPWYFIVPGSLFIIMIGVLLGSRWLKNPWLLELQHGIEVFGAWINNIVITAALFIAYVGGIGLAAMPARFMGKKFFKITIDHSAPSWWEPLNLSRQKRERYYDMF